MKKRRHQPFTNWLLPAPHKGHFQFEGSSLKGAPRLYSILRVAYGGIINIVALGALVAIHVTNH